MIGLVSFCSSRGNAAQSAKTLLAKGNELFGKGNYNYAYEVFKEGYESSPSPVFLRSMGHSLLKLYKHEEAHEAFLLYLKQYPKAKDSKDIQELVKNLEIVVQTRIKVASDPAGVELYFDTEAGGKIGATPYQGTIEPGKHIAILKGPGFSTITRTFSINPKQSLELKLTMEVPLEVTSNPSGCLVHLDSDKSPVVGRTPFNGSVSIGKHTIYLLKPGFKSYTTSILAEPMQSVIVSAALNLGLKVQSEPPGARVTVDGKTARGSTPLETDITLGKHKVILSLAGYKDSTQEVLISSERNNVLNVKLSGGLLSMRTNVAGATVTVGGKVLGKTPLTRAGVPLGRQQVSVRHPRLKGWNGAIDFDENNLVETDVKLGRPLWPVWVSAGVAVAGFVLGTVGAVLAHNDLRNDENQPTSCQLREGGCNYSNHHMSTAGFVIGGTAAATGLLYYFVWGRTSFESRQVPASNSAKRSGPVVQ
jgi:hypothetical protein